MNDRTNTGWGFETFTYHRDQVEQLAKAYIANGRSASRALFSTELLWDSKSWGRAVQVVELVEKIEQASRKVGPDSNRIADFLFRPAEDRISCSTKS